MQAKWPTRERDLAITAWLMEKHADKRGTVPLVEVYHHERSLELTHSAWFKELYACFVGLYGEADADRIVNNVLSIVLIHNQVYH